MAEKFIDSIEGRIDAPRQRWGWALAIGRLSVAAGVFAILFPLVASGA